MARDVAALASASVIDSRAIACEEGKSVADRALEPETAETAGIEADVLIPLRDAARVTINEARYEGEEVLSTL